MSFRKPRYIVILYFFLFFLFYFPLSLPFFTRHVFEYMARTVGSLRCAAITNITRTRSLRAPLKLIIYTCLVGISFLHDSRVSARENMTKSRNLTNEFRYVDTHQTIDVGGVEILKDICRKTNNIHRTIVSSRENLTNFFSS